MKHPENITYKDPKLEPILNVTYGVLVYQEQVQQIFRDLAGFSLGRADIVRRAMGKKKLKIMEEEKQHFLHGLKDESGNTVIEGALARGVDAKVCNELMDQMTAFASYAFNKAHAAAYAYVAYQTAYLKCHYPQEFMAAMISSVIADKDKIAKYCQTCTDMNIEIVPPSVNISEDKFSVHDDKVVFGLAALQNVGSSLMKEVVKERETNGKFTSFVDFVRRISSSVINKKAYEALIKAGAFDWTGYNRASLYSSFESITNTVKNYSSEQTTLFDYIDIDYLIPPVKECAEWDRLQLLNNEIDVCSIYISGHPFEEYSNVIKTLDTPSFADLNEAYSTGMSLHETKASVVGIIKSIQKKTSKNKTSNYYLVSLESSNGSGTVFVFSSVYDRCASVLQENKVCMFNINIQERDGSLSYSALNIFELPNNNVGNANYYNISRYCQKNPVTVKKTNVISNIKSKEVAPKKTKTTHHQPGVYVKVYNRGELDTMLTIAAQYPGTNALYFVTKDKNNEYKTFICKTRKVSYSNEFIENIASVFGNGRLTLIK